MRLARILLCGALALFATASLAHPTMTPELFRKFWPNYDSSVVKRIRLDDAKKAEIAKALGGEFPKTLNDVDVFIVSSPSSTLGVLANLDLGTADIGVAMDRSRNKIVKVYFYDTTKDMAPINTPAFLKQFTGKTAAQAFQVGKDIKPVKGAEKQSEFAARIVKGTVLYLQKGW
jgi:hypothetical protein